METAKDPRNGSTIVISLQKSQTGEWNKHQINQTNFSMINQTNADVTPSLTVVSEGH